MLLPRIITALIGVPVVLAAIHFGGAIYMAFVGCVILFCLYEYGLVLTAGKKPVHMPALVLFGLLMAAVAIVGRMPSRVCNTFTGVFFMPWALAHLINLRDIPQYGEYLTLFMIITVWVSDTGAYFCGRLLGRHKLNVEVSPKKTWEGAVGGTLLAVGAAVLMAHLFLSNTLSVKTAVILGLLIAIVGQVSDLAESVIKRSTGVKDSSNLLPGHGGFLDRFDSYLLLAPLFYYVVLYTIKL